MATPAGLNRGPAAQFGSSVVNVPHQTTAAIAKELLDTGRCKMMHTDIVVKFFKELTVLYSI